MSHARRHRDAEVSQSLRDRLQPLLSLLHEHLLALGLPGSRLEVFVAEKDKNGTSECLQPVLPGDIVDREYRGDWGRQDDEECQTERDENGEHEDFALEEFLMPRMIKMTNRESAEILREANCDKCNCLGALEGISRTFNSPVFNPFPIELSCFACNISECDSFRQDSVSEHVASEGIERGQIVDQHNKGKQNNVNDDETNTNRSENRLFRGSGGSLHYIGLWVISRQRQRWEAISGEIDEQDLQRR